MIAGGHEWAFERGPTEARREIPDGILHLRDSDVTMEGVRLWSAPWQPFFNSWVFNLERPGANMAAMWARVQEDVRVLITHDPPFGILDGAGWRFMESVPRSSARPVVGGVPSLVSRH